MWLKPVITDMKFPVTISGQLMHLGSYVNSLDCLYTAMKSSKVAYWATGHYFKERTSFLGKTTIENQKAMKNAEQFVIVNQDERKALVHKQIEN